MPGTPPQAPAPASHARRDVLPHAWLAARYWAFSWAILALAVPLALAAGTWADAVGIGAYVVLTASCHAAARWSRGASVWVHLIALVPYWSAYMALDAGLPSRAGHGAPGFAAMLMFPILVVTALARNRGVVAILTLSLAALLHRFGATLEGAIGAFLVGLASLIGFVFRLPVRNLERAYAELEQIAERDPLTHLANRRGFDAIFGREGATASRGFVLLVDLARFRAINEGFGHRVGDALLAAVARRIGEVAGRSRPMLLAARVDGDEFALVGLERGLDDATKIAEQIVEALGESFALEGRVLHVEAHVGIACFETTRDPAVLLGRARQALYAGRAAEERVSAFTEERSSHPDTPLELREALERGELIPYFQPIVDLETGTIVGAEALVRWRHPRRGLLTPAAFIGPAEACGLAADLDRAVIRASVEQIDRWRAAGRDFWVAVNVSARSLEDPSFADWMAQLLDEHAVPRGRVVVEITESAAMRNPEPCARVLGALRDMGVESALDDFGMGYSSLAYLKRLPASHLKLDRMFVSGIGVSERDEGVIELLLDLARKFQMDVVAEGIETREQLEWLRARSCAFAQGYLLGMPVPAEELDRVSIRVSGEFLVAPPASGVEAPARRRRPAKQWRTGSH